MSARSSACDIFISLSFSYWLTIFRRSFCFPILLFSFGLACSFLLVHAWIFAFTNDCDSFTLSKSSCLLDGLFFMIPNGKNAIIFTLYIRVDILYRFPLNAIIDKAIKFFNKNV